MRKNQYVFNYFYNSHDYSVFNIRIHCCIPRKIYARLWEVWELLYTFIEVDLCEPCVNDIVRGGYTYRRPVCVL